MKSIPRHKSQLARLTPLIATVTLVCGCATSSPKNTTAESTNDKAATVASGQTASTPTPRRPRPETTAAEPATATEPAAASKTEGAASGEPTKSEAKIIKGTGVFIKPPQPEAPVAVPANAPMFNFEGADIREVAKTILGDILHESYVVDPRVQGTVSLRTVRPVPQSALIPTLESLLKVNGAVLVREAGMFKILPSKEVRGSVSPQPAGRYAGFSVQVVPLRYISAREMAKILEPFAPEGGIMRVDEVRNLLMLAGSQYELQHMLDTVDTFDVDWLKGMSVGFFPLKSADVKTLGAELDKLLGDTATSPIAGIVRVVPIERLNGFVVVTTQPRYLEQAREWIERLDRSGSGGGQRLYVYNVQNSRAETLADLLTQTFSPTTTGTATTSELRASLAPGMGAATLRSGPGALSSSTTSSGLGASSSSTMSSGLGSTSTLNAPNQVAAPSAISISSGALEGGATGLPSAIRIVADPHNNALVILASPSDYERIEAALRKLDVEPRQVLIDVTIAEVTLTGDLKYGLEWIFSMGKRNDGYLDTGATGISGLTPGFSYIYRQANGVGIQAVLNALANNRKLNVLSSPHIMVADNQAAKIQVGDSVPVAGPQTITGTGIVTSSVQYVDTGVILNVRPRVNASGMVTLELEQEVSSASVTSTSGLNSPTISKRSTKSTVTVQSGETMVLGGLISETRTESSSGLPVLSALPLVGGLFGTVGNNRDKTELILTITPRVATSTHQAHTLSEEFRKKVPNAGVMLRLNPPPTRPGGEPTPELKPAPDHPGE